jgi:CheY-like chemotaxis protein
MSHTILVADDSVTIQRAIQIAFDKEPYRVMRAMNGDDALQQAKTAAPSIILVDHAMPGKTGYELAEALREDPATSSIPVVFMSGPSAPYDEARAQRAGIVAHIAKPFDCQSLIEKVGSVLGVAPSVPLSGTPAPAAAPVSAVASALPRPPGPVGANPFGAAAAPVAAAAVVAAPIAATPVAAAPVATAPASRADPFGLAANASTTTSSSASDEEEDISFGFEDAKKPAAPVVTTQNASVATAARIETPAVSAAVVSAVSHSVSVAAAPAIASAVVAGGHGNGASPAAITAATREIIEQIVWEVVPELAETIIRAEIARLLRERT